MVLFIMKENDMIEVPSITSMTATLLKIHEAVSRLEIDDMRNPRVVNSLLKCNGHSHDHFCATGPQVKIVPFVVPFCRKFAILFGTTYLHCKTISVSFILEKEHDLLVTLN